VILGRCGRIDLAIHALLESVVVMTAMTVLLLLLGRLFLVRRVLCLFFALPLRGGTRVVGVLRGAGVRGGGRTTVA
jgi:hypothetical protein